MTREEAIEIFKNMLDAWDNYYTIAQSDKKREAVWLAISSLETDEAYQLEYERTTKNDLGVDYIDRKAIEKHIEDGLNSGKYGHDAVNIMAEIHFMPSVTPQEPTGKNFTKTDIDAIVKAINAHWELIIDEIRAEIETEKLEDSSNFCIKAHNIAVDRVLQILDKYKESEADNGNVD